MGEVIPTPEQVEVGIDLAGGEGTWIGEQIALALARAVAEEREACAVLADRSTGLSYHIAAAIRARSGGAK